MFSVVTEKFVSYCKHLRGKTVKRKINVAYVYDILCINIAYVYKIY